MPDQLTPDSFMSSLPQGSTPPQASGGELTPDSFMAGQQQPPSQQVVTSVGTPTKSGKTTSTPYMATDYSGLANSPGDQMKQNALSKVGGLMANEPEVKSKANIQAQSYAQQKTEYLKKKNAGVPDFFNPPPTPPTGGERWMDKLIDPYSIAQNMMRGSEQMTNPDTTEKLRGAGKVISGTAQLATPGLMGEAAIAHPLKTILWYAGSTALGKGAQKVAEKAGANPEDAQEIGDLAGNLPMLYGMGKGAADSLSEQHAQIKSASAQKFQAKGDLLQTARQLAGGTLAEPTPVRILTPDGPSDAEVQVSTTDQNGRPLYKVVKKDGTIAFGGTGQDVSEWLGQRAVDAKGRLFAQDSSGKKPSIAAVDTIDQARNPEATNLLKQGRVAEQATQTATPEAPTQTPSTAAQAALDAPGEGASTTPAEEALANSVAKKIQSGQADKLKGKALAKFQADLETAHGIAKRVAAATPSESATPETPTAPAVHPALADLPTPDQAVAQAEQHAQQTVETLSAIGEAAQQPPPISPEWDLSSKVEQAKQLAQQSDQSGQHVASIGHADPEVTTLAHTMQQGPEEFGAAVDRFHDHARQNQDGAPVGVFEPMNRQEAFEDSFGKLPEAPAPQTAAITPDSFMAEETPQKAEVSNDNEPSVSVERNEPAAEGQEEQGRRNVQGTKSEEPAVQQRSDGEAKPQDRALTEPQQQALEYVRANPGTKVSEIQRKFKLGYGMASRVLDAAKTEKATPVKQEAKEAKPAPVRKSWQESALKKLGRTERRLYDFIEEAEDGNGENTPISAPQLRKDMSDLSKEEFDRTAMALRNAGLVYGSTHDHPAQLSEGDRANLIDTGEEHQPNNLTGKPERRYFAALQRTAEEPALPEPIKKVKSSEDVKSNSKFVGHAAERISREFTPFKNAAMNTPNTAHVHIDAMKKALRDAEQFKNVVASDKAKKHLAEVMAQARTLINEWEKVSPKPHLVSPSDHASPHIEEPEGDGNVDDEEEPDREVEPSDFDEEETDVGTVRDEKPVEPPSAENGESIGLLSPDGSPISEGERGVIGQIAERKNGVEIHDVAQGDREYFFNLLRRGFIKRQFVKSLDGFRYQLTEMGQKAVPAKAAEPAPTYKPWQEAALQKLGRSERHLYDAIADNEDGNGEIAVSSNRLRKAVPDLSKEEFDRTAVALNKAGLVYGSTHDHPYQLSEADRAQLIDTGRDDWYQDTSERNLRRHWVALSRLAEPVKKPADVTAETTTHDLGALRNRLDEINSEMSGGKKPVGVSRLRELRAERAEIEKKLSDTTPATTPVETAATPVAPAAAEPSALHPKMADLVRALGNKLRTKEGIKNTPELVKIAAKTLGQGLTAGGYDVKDLYDALETAVNQQIIERYASNNEIPSLKPAEAIRRLNDLTAKLPTQTARTKEQKEFQQFSTPPALSYVAARVANLKPGETVAEPSAGTGSLAAFAKGEGANVETNELSPRRREFLQMQGYTPTPHNAEHIRDFRPDLKPDVVLMNPPFSASAGRLSANSNAIGYKHVLSALDMLPENGRLVAILGRGASAEHVTAAPFFKAIADRGATVRANIGLNGQNYRKYGTDFDNRLLVIDKAKSDLPQVTGDFDSLEEASHALEPVRDSRPDIQRAAPETGRPGTSLVAGGGSGSEVSGGQLPAGEVGDGGGRPGQRPGRPAGNAGQPGPAEGAPTPAPTEPDAGSLSQPEQQPAGSDGGSDQHVGGLQLKTGEAPKGKLTETGTFQSYRPAKLRTGVSHGKATGTDLVETGALASVEPPDITYSPHLPEEIIKNGHVTDAQLEAITYAGQAHTQTLADGKRAGFMIGDGTGVGKGTEAAGVVLDNWNQGRKRTLWLSLKPDLINQAQRDLDWVNSGIKAKLINDFGMGTPVQHEGVLFASYSTLHRVGTGDQSRLQQILDWKPDVIILDESHSAKNAVGGNAEEEEAGEDGPGSDGSDRKGPVYLGPTASKAGRAVLDLDKKLPDSRMVYMSATGFTDTRNLGYANRLGLWGPGTAFPTFNDFNVQIDRGGLPAMELVAKDLKANGRYMARQISFKGVTYREHEAALTEGQRQMYDAGAKAWQGVLANIDKAIESILGDDNPRSKGLMKSRALSQFWSANQRFYRSLITAMKIPATIEEIEGALKEGNSVFIDLVSTGEAEQNRQLLKMAAEGTDAADLDMSAKQTIVNFIDKSFPIHTMEDYEDPETKAKGTRVVIGPDGKPLVNQEALKMREDLKKGLDSIQMPMSAMDQLIDYFGGDKVAEVSGRKSRMVTDPSTGLPMEKPRMKPKGATARNVNDWERQQFQSGKKRIAIASGAGGTGFDFHADKRIANQQRRTHIILEPSWSADAQMQKLGRTHRTNQANAPEYVLIASDLGGEKRFISAIANRIASLGALTRGERKAAGGAGELLQKYNVEGKYGEAAAKIWLDGIDSPRNAQATNQEDVRIELPKPPQELVDQSEQVLRMMGAIKDTKTGPVAQQMPVRQFLNRVLNLPTDLQRQAFDYFMGLHDAIVGQLREAGALDEGTQELPLENPRIVHRENFYVGDAKQPTTHLTVEGESPVSKNSWQSAESHANYGKWDAATGDLRGLWRNNRTGKLWMARRAASDITNQKTGVTEPAMALLGLEHKNRQQVAAAKMRDLYTKIPNEQAKAEWTKGLAALPDTNTEQVHLFTGSVLPLWRQLSEASEGYKTPISMVRDADGSAMSGIEVPKERVKALIEQLSGKGDFTPDAVLDRARNGERIALRDANLTVSKIMGQGAIVIQAAGKAAQESLTRLGLKSMETAGAVKHYLPLPEGGDDGAALAKLGDVLKAFPPKGAEDVDLAARSLRQPPAGATPDQEMALADAKFVPGPVNGTGKVYVNTPAFAAIAAIEAAARGVNAGKSLPEGRTLGAPQIHAIVDGINQSLANPLLPRNQKEALFRVGNEIVRAHTDNPLATAFVLVDPRRPVSELKATVRHEGIHQAQVDLIADSGEPLESQVDPSEMFAHPALAKAAVPIEKGYEKSVAPEHLDALVAIEVPAWLGGGQYKAVGLSRQEALDGLGHYFDLLQNKYGPHKALSVLARVQPDLKKELYGRITDTRANRRTSEKTSTNIGDASAQNADFKSRALRPAAEPDAEPRLDAARGSADAVRRRGGLETTARRPAGDIKSDLANLSSAPIAGSGTRSEGEDKHGALGESLPEGRQGGAGEGLRRTVPGEEGGLNESRRSGIVLSRRASGPENGPADQAKPARKPGDGINDSLDSTLSDRPGPTGGAQDEAADQAIASRKASQGGFLKVQGTDPDEPLANYSGMGAVGDYRRNLSQLRRASEPAHGAATEAAAWKAQAAATLHTAIPRIEEAMEGKHSFNDLQRGLIESNLRGKRERWQNMADQASRASDTNLQSSLPRLLPLLDVLQDKMGLPRNLADTATALIANKDFDGLRKLLSEQFNAAASRVAHIMTDGEFSDLSHSPYLRRGLDIYKNEIEAPMARAHAMNEGVFQDATGPWGTYYPLTPVREEPEAQARPQSLRGYKTPTNKANHFATGLSEAYDDSSDALRQKFMTAVRDGSKAAMFQTFQDEGLLRQLAPFERAPAEIEYKGQMYHAVKVQTGEGRTIIKGGKRTDIPPQFAIIPDWLEGELRPILEKQRLSKGDVVRVLQKVNGAAIAGPADAIYHTVNLAGTLAWNAPFLLPAMVSTTMRNGIGQIGNEFSKMMNTDAFSKENAAALQRLARIGALPERFGSATYSKRYADQVGAERHFDSGPFLYGPKGVDVRARLFMHNLATALNPDVSDSQLALWVNQLGQYVESLQGAVVRSVKRTGLAPFAEAGVQMSTNGVNAWTGRGPMPEGGMKGEALRAYRMLTMGAIGAVALWIMAQKAYTGKFPWEDKRSRLFEIPVNPEDRYSKLGRMRWGNGPETGYINTTFFNPLLMRGARATGIKGAADTLMEGGQAWQAWEAAERDILNTWSHPFMGPIPRAAFVGLTGDEPYLTSLRDDRARYAPQLMPAVKNPHGAAGTGKRALAAARELNPTLFDVGNAGVTTLEHFYGDPSWNSGLGHSTDKGDEWFQMVTNLALPNVMANAQNPAKQSMYLHRQANAARRQK